MITWRGAFSLFSMSVLPGVIAWGLGVRGWPILLFCAWAALVLYAWGVYVGNVQGRVYVLQNPPKRGAVIAPVQVTLGKWVMYTATIRPIVFNDQLDNGIEFIQSWGVANGQAENTSMLKAAWAESNTPVVEIKQLAETDNYSRSIPPKELSQLVQREKAKRNIEKVKEYIAENPKITNRELSNLLGVDYDTIRRYKRLLKQTAQGV